jgi:hypothetical protein
MRTVTTALLASSLAGVLVGCPPPGAGPGGGTRGGGGAAVSPDACGNISTSDAGRKLYAFLRASADLDRASLELEGSVRSACARMATELGVPATGDTRAVCAAARQALADNLQVSVRTESRLVTRYAPPECTTDVDFAASFAAECEARVAADIAVTCEGSCGGTCRGECDGACSGSTGAGGTCDGVCEGTCRGSCSADCRGYADVDASVECKASAEVSASVRTVCTEPKVETVREDVTVVDDAKFQRAMAAIDAGMPTLLQVGAKASLVGKSTVLWGRTLGALVAESGELVGKIGQQGLCVAGQLTAALAAVAQVEARVSVSVEVSAEVSASAGAQAQ